MGWISIVLAIIQFAPQIIAAVKALIDSIESMNAEKGGTAVSQAAELAAQIVTSFETRTGMTSEAKREQAVADLIAGSRSVGVTLSESTARTLVELAVQQVKAKGV